MYLASGAGVIIELRLAGVDDDIIALPLTEVDLGAANRQPHRAGRRYPTDEVVRLPAGANLIYRTQRRAIAMRVLQRPIDPGLRASGQAIGVQFARGKHHLAIVARDGVAVNIHIGEIVVGLQALALVVGFQQRLVIPQADVGDGLRAGGDVGLTERLDVVRAYGDAVQVECLPRGGNVVGNIGRFQRNLAGLDDEVLDDAGVDRTDQNGGDDPEGNCPPQQGEGAKADVEQQQQRADRGDYQQDPIAGQLGVDVGVIRAVEDAVIGKEQLVLVEAIADREGCQIERGQDAEVDAHCVWHRDGDDDRLTPAQDAGQGDSGTLAPHQPRAADVYRGDCNYGDEQQGAEPATQRIIEGQGEDIEADILVEDWIGVAERTGVEEAQHILPVARRAEGEEDAKEDGDGPDQRAELIGGNV